MKDVQRKSSAPEIRSHSEESTSKADEPEYTHHPNYLALERHYVEHPIVLYTGAGVSWAKKPEYGLRGWEELLRRILRVCKGADSPYLVEFDSRLRRKWAEEPWEIGEWVAERCGVDSFKALVMKIVRSEGNFPPVYDQLSRKFLNNAPTLNAVCAFCTRLLAAGLETTHRTYEIHPNPRVQAVITSNYDPFLEAASSTMFIKPVLKPVAAIGSSVGKLNQIPVFHIHGYVPVRESKSQKGQEDLRPAVGLVVKKDDYESAWRWDDVFCPTIGPQAHWLRYYTTLFVGFSFRDRWVSRLLRYLNQEQEEREKSTPGKRLYHYALMMQTDIQSRSDDFAELGIRPIPLGDFDEIPNLLGRLYQRALEFDYKGALVELPVVGRGQRSRKQEHVYMTPKEYWEDLMACRTHTVRRKNT